MMSLNMFEARCYGGLVKRSILDDFEKACELVRNKGMGHGPRCTGQLEQQEKGSVPTLQEDK